MTGLLKKGKKKAVPIIIETAFEFSFSYLLGQSFFDVTLYHHFLSVGI